VVHYFLLILIGAAIVLSIFGVLPYVWWHILVQVTILWIACYATNFIFGKIFNVQPNTIAGLSLPKF